MRCVLSNAALSGLWFPLSVPLGHRDAGVVQLLCAAVSLPLGTHCAGIPIPHGLGSLCCLCILAAERALPFLTSLSQPTSVPCLNPLAGGNLCELLHVVLSAVTLSACSLCIKRE